MSIQTELTRITNAKSAIKTAIEGKGVTVPSGTLLDGMAALIESIEAGGGNVASGSFTPADRLSDVTVEHGLGVAPSTIVVVPMPTGANDKTNPIAFYIAKKDAGGIKISGSGFVNENFSSLNYRTTSAADIAGQWAFSGNAGPSSCVVSVDAQKFVVKSGFGARTILWFAEA